MTHEQPLRDLRQHLIDDLIEIEAAVEGYVEGRSSAYQTVAGQLRNLLTDTSRAGPLLIRVLPDATFHRLRPPTARPDDAESVTVWEFDPRGSISIGGGLPVVSLELTGELIPVEDWLDDWIVTRNVRIRDLIHEVASKDVAHTVPERGPTMATLEANQYLINSGTRFETARPVIVGVGEYVARRARELLGGS